MIRAIVIPLALLATACGGHSTKPAPALCPAPERLPDRLRSSCPPLPLLADPLLGTLVLGDAASSKLYEECQAKHASMVQQYDAVDVAIARFNADREAGK